MVDHVEEMNADNVEEKAVPMVYDLVDFLYQERGYSFVYRVLSQAMIYAGELREKDGPFSFDS